MSVRALLLAGAVVLLLAGCKGSGGSSGGPTAPPSSPPSPPSRNAPLEFCYFGVTRREEIAEWADHCTCLWLMDWPAFTENIWDTPDGHKAIADEVIARLQEARRLGINKAVIACGFLMFTPEYGYRNNAELQLFRQRVSDAGLLFMVCGISLIDEPDMHNITDSTMAAAFRDARAAWPEAKINVIYGDHGTPGKDEADIIGRDDYPAADGVLAKLPAIRADQSYWLVPGGCSPWMNRPESFLAFARAHVWVHGICAFRWFDHPSGAGIRSNGMADAYRAVGRAIKAGTLES